MNARTRMNIGVLILGLLAALLAGRSRAEIIPGNWVLYKGTAIVKPRVDHPTLEKCHEQATGLGVAATYTCRSIAQVVVPPKPTDPVDPDSDMSQPPAAPRPVPAAPAARTDAQTLLRVKAYTGAEPPTPAGDGVGSFRLKCNYSHMAFDDPIVFPGQPGKSHLHVFFGNTSTSGLTTTESLAASKSSTCAGGVANLSGYWVPALIDTQTMRAIVPSSALFYYKKGYNDLTASQIKIPPNGLRVITGRSAVATSAPSNYEPYTARFQCWPNGKNNGTPLAYSLTIPAACPAGADLDLELSFPNCWDGKNFDSPDHRSHMAHARSYNPRVCPASHPVAIPTITLNITYKLAGPGNKYRLSSDNYAANLPGGYSLHGDVWIVWDESIKAAWMKNCINASMDCNAELLGDGRTLY